MKDALKQEEIVEAFLHVLTYANYAEAVVMPVEAGMWVCARGESVMNRNGEIEPERWIKECPCFDAASMLHEPIPANPAYSL